MENMKKEINKDQLEKIVKTAINSNRSVFERLSKI